MFLFIGTSSVSAVPAVVKVGNSDYFALRSADDLVWFRNYINAGDSQANALLINDIDISSVCASGAWEQIARGGVYSEEKTWNGTFDGNGKQISGFTVNTKDANVGLFGFVGGTVKNLTVAGSIKCLYGNVAAVATYNRGLIENCISKTRISVSERENVSGGVAGIVSKSAGRENGCINKGDISLPTELLIDPKGHIIGGIVAVKASGDVLNCINYATITAVSAEVGGIAGMCQSDATKLQSCLSAGVINIDKTWQEHIGAFVSTAGSKPVMRNNYYIANTSEYAVVDKSSTLIDKKDIKSGRAAYLLQGDRSEYVWGQKIGKDFEPVFTKEAKMHLHKVSYNLVWNNTSIEKFVNNGSHVRLPIATDVFDNLDGSTWYDLSFECDSRKFDSGSVANKDMTINVTAHKVEMAGGMAAPPIFPVVNEPENFATK